MLRGEQSQHLWSHRRALIPAHPLQEKDVPHSHASPRLCSSPQKHRQNHVHRTHANTLTCHIYSHMQTSMYRYKHHVHIKHTHMHTHMYTPPHQLQPSLRVSTYRQRPHTQSTEGPAEGKIKEAAGCVKTGWGIRQNKKEPLSYRDQLRGQGRKGLDVVPKFPPPHP